jgi:lytic murein transglycosylase
VILAVAAGAQPVVPAAPPPAPVPDLPPSDDVVGGGVEADFAAWLAGFRAAELAKGVSPAALDAVLGGLRYSPRVVELDRAQPDDSGRTAVFADYAGRHVEGLLIARGRSVHAELGTDLANDEAATGVPAAIILGIWGMESSYRPVANGFDVPRSLATLAFDGRRRDLFTRELDAVVRVVAQGGIDRDRLTGSWAGAMGQPQFLPSTYLAWARDGDGDGRADIWESRSDIALSIATFVAGNGWQRGQGWGFEVMVPADLDRDRVRNLVAPATCVRVLARHSRWLTIAEWRALGLIPAAAWPDDTTLATLVEPDGPGGRAFLTLGNYRALLGYNCSNFYALSVGLLSDALR